MKKLLLLLTLSLSSTIFCSEKPSLTPKRKPSPSLSEKRENLTQVNLASFSLIMFALANATPDSTSSNPAFSGSQSRAKDMSSNPAYSASQLKAKNMSSNPTYSASQSRAKKRK